MILIYSEVTAQMHVVRVGAQALGAKRFNHDLTAFDGLEDLFIG
jgi:hypothetical protein